MENFNMTTAIDHLINGELELFKRAIQDTIHNKIGQTFEEKKQELAQEMFSEEEECSECGDNVQENKKFAALAPPYDKPTRADRIAGALLNKKGKK